MQLEKSRLTLRIILWVSRCNISRLTFLNRKEGVKTPFRRGGEIGYSVPLLSQISIH